MNKLVVEEFKIKDVNNNYNIFANYDIDSCNINKIAITFKIV